MDIFNILGSGAKFDKKRFKSDIQLFKPVNQIQENQVKINDLDLFNVNPIKPVEKTDVIESESIEFENPEIQQVKNFRNLNKIKIEGADVPNPVQSIPNLLETFKLRSFLETGLKNKFSIQNSYTHSNASYSDYPI